MMPFNTQAAGFGAWTITNTVAQGASTILTGSKEVILNGAKKIATGTAKITPTASQVSKVLARGAAGYALSVAVQQLLGAVDWVLDPANNRIKYYSDSSDLNDPSIQYHYIALFGNTTHTTIEAAAAASLAERKKMGDIEFTGTINYTSSQAYACYKYNSSTYCDFPLVSQIANPAYDPNAQPEREEKSIPLDVVAQQVISNAQGGDTNAQVATTAAAADIINEAENDNVKARPIVQQLENTQSIPTDQTVNGDAVPKENANTENPSSSVAAPATDLTLDFPIFCDWAPSICQAAKEVIALPITLTNWWDSATTSITESWTWVKSRYEAAVTSISEFFSQETNTDTELEFNDPTQITDTSISFSNQCPAPITLADFSYHGISQKWEMNFSPWCDVISTFIKPIVIAMAGFSAVLIVSGVRENG